MDKRTIEIPWTELGEISAEDVADWLQLEHCRERGKRACVWCDSSDGLEVRWRAKGGRARGVKCFACGRHGDAIDMVQAAFDVGKIDAAIMLAERFGVQLGEREARPTITAGIVRQRQRREAREARAARHKEMEAHQRGGVSAEQRREVLHELWTRLNLTREARDYLRGRSMDPLVAWAAGVRGIDEHAFAELQRWLGPERLRALGFRSEKNWPIIRAGVLVIPYRDEQGDVTTLRFRALPSASRAWARDRRYFSLVGDHPSTLFNLPALERARRGHLPLYVCEGELNALALAHYGLCAVASSGASTMRAELVESWGALQRVTLVVDGDDAGEQWAVKVYAECARAHGLAWTDRVLEIRGMGDGADAADHLRAGTLLPALGLQQPAREDVELVARSFGCSALDAERIVYQG